MIKKCILGEHKRLLVKTFESLFMSTLCIKWEKAKKSYKILKLNWLIDAYAQDEEFERSPRQRVRSDVENLGPVSSKTPQTFSFNSPPTLHNRKAQELKPLHPDHWPRYLHGSEQTLTLLWFGVWLSLHIPVTLQALRSRNSVFCVFTQAFFPSHTKIQRKHLLHWKFKMDMLSNMAWGWNNTWPRIWAVTQDDLRVCEVSCWLWTLLIVKCYLYTVLNYRLVNRGGNTTIKTISWNIVFLKR